MSAPSGTKRSDLLGGLTWMALGVVILAACWRMDRFESMGGTVYTAPGLVPGLFGLALLALGGVLAWRGARAPESPVASMLWAPRVLVALALMLAYAALLVSRLPFWLATGLFVAAFIAWFSGDRDPPASWRQRWLLAAACGAGTAVVITLVFERVFLVRLP
jgi:hypothetical protein